MSVLSRLHWESCLGHYRALVLPAPTEKNWGFGCRTLERLFLPPNPIEGLCPYHSQAALDSPRHPRCTALPISSSLGALRLTCLFMPLSPESSLGPQPRGLGPLEAISSLFVECRRRRSHRLAHIPPFQPPSHLPSLIWTVKLTILCPNFLQS